jgi:formate dehydrogenase subunit delta
MDPHKLVKMVNEIAAFFESETDTKVVSEGIAGHVRRFWDPRMRRELLRWVDEQGGVGLKASVLAAIAAHREALTPRST